MNYVLKTKDLKEVETYRPVDFKLVVGSYLLLICFIGCIVTSVTTVPNAWLVILGTLFFYGLLSLVVSDWQGKYWHRDIVGYTLWVTKDKEYYVTHRNDSCMAEEKKVILRLPLGGWFRGQARIVGDGFEHLFTVTSFSLHPRDNIINVVVKDLHGSKVKIWASALLRILNKVTGPWQWGMLLDNMFLHADYLEMKKIVAEAYAETLRKSMFLAAQALADSSRVGKSKEGKRIHDDLILGLVAGSPKDSNGYKAFVDEVGRIMAERAGTKRRGTQAVIA